MTYTEKRLELFDEAFADYFVIKTGIMADHKGSIKSFLAETITQARAEERKRVVMEMRHIIFRTDDKHSFLKNINGTQYLNKNILFQILFSTDKPKT